MKAKRESSGEQMLFVVLALLVVCGLVKLFLH
jgi:hypothetical protein